MIYSSTNSFYLHIFCSYIISVFTRLLNTIIFFFSNFFKFVCCCTSFTYLSHFFFLIFFNIYLKYFYSLIVSTLVSFLLLYHTLSFLYLFHSPPFSCVSYTFLIFYYLLSLLHILLLITTPCTRLVYFNVRFCFRSFYEFLSYSGSFACIFLY